LRTIDPFKNLEKTAKMLEEIPPDAPIFGAGRTLAGPGVTFSPLAGGSTLAGGAAGTGDGETPEPDDQVDAGKRLG
jgi:hypothetical protein